MIMLLWRIKQGKILIFVRRQSNTFTAGPFLFSSGCFDAFFVPACSKNTRRVLRAAFTFVFVIVVCEKVAFGLSAFQCL
jgi:hypothetical protein